MSLNDIIYLNIYGTILNVQYKIFIFHTYPFVLLEKITKYYYHPDYNNIHFDCDTVITKVYRINNIEILLKMEWKKETHLIKKENQ